MDMESNVGQIGSEIERLLRDVRQIQINSLGINHATSSADVTSLLDAYVTHLRAGGWTREAAAIDVVNGKATQSTSFGGLGLRSTDHPTEEQVNELKFLVEAWLESLNSEDASRDYLQTVKELPHDTQPMNLAEKIFAQHALNSLPPTGLRAGAVIRVGIDWILASELSWKSMARTYAKIGSPGIWRNDRFWIAGDHVAHPLIYDNPKIKAYIESAEKAKKDFRMTQYQGMNYTIMHTEFVREHAQPGMLVLGSDSHTCSAGAVGCLAIGLGTADVMMSCALGETWFKVPESIFIGLTGTPLPGISGKDVILYILQQLKRNTVAAERIVEFGGEGRRYLSCDARFAISNMCTEFGAVTGIFIPDEITQHYVSRRGNKANREKSLYFQPDANATYADHYTIDLGKVEPSIAVYPDPDNVVPVSAKADLPLDGVFIGACTTTEEELVLAALVLKVGLSKNFALKAGKRHYVPGSLPIVERLRTLGLLDIYEKAGFTRGPPGCSYCVGLSAEKASEGETWLSSQNRNFQNRMGKGAVGHVTSAVVCAASSFSMSITDPAELLAEVDLAFYKTYRAGSNSRIVQVNYVQPDLAAAAARTETPTASPAANIPDTETPPFLQRFMSRVVRLGDFIDTDALVPGSALTTCVTDAEFGAHVLEHTHPSFRAQVHAGQRVVVAGSAFGVGSSREVAVSALKGAGVQAVIARSFAFIYQRNQPSLGLLGFTIDDEEFYEQAADGAEIVVDVPARTVSLGGKAFAFTLSGIEYQLLANSGVAQAYKKYGRSLWSSMMRAADSGVELKRLDDPTRTRDDTLDW